MTTPHEDLRAMLRIRQYLQEAQDWAKEADIVAPNPANSDAAGSGAADPKAPASVMPLIDASAERADIVISSLRERPEVSGAAE